MISHHFYQSILIVLPHVEQFASRNKEIQLYCLTASFLEIEVEWQEHHKNIKNLKMSFQWFFIFRIRWQTRRQRCWIIWLSTVRKLSDVFSNPWKTITNGWQNSWRRLSTWQIRNRRTKTPSIRRSWYFIGFYWCYLKTVVYLIH